MAIASGCGGADNSAYLGSWLGTGGQTTALRVTDATGSVLVDYLDLARPSQDQTVFTTQADVEGDTLRLQYESDGGEIIKGGKLQIAGGGGTLVWTSGSGERREFRTVATLPAPDSRSSSQ
jgi:hypothetical protein